MDYIIIMPAYNEEELIAQAIESIAQQSILPKKLLIVNDGSTDRTAEIIESFGQKYPWIQLVNHDKKEGHAAGSKVVRAFYVGFNSLKEEFDILVKLDADLELPANYFEKVLNMFKANPKLGIAGGTIVMEKDGEWIYENFSDEDHVKGAYKAYRAACFQDIGGLRHSIGWDTADEMLARFHGWEIQVDTSLQVKHFRELGTHTGSVKIREQVGYGMYRLRYGFWITLISAMKAGYLNKPYVITGISVLWGWLKSFFKGDKFMVTKEEGQFIRQFRWKRMLQKLKIWG